MQIAGTLKRQAEVVMCTYVVRIQPQSSSVFLDRAM
jgi:hypothetical protein